VETLPLVSPVLLTLETVEGPIPVLAQLEYRPADPYAVAALFDTGAERPVRWVFARDLLDEGLVHQSGEGDVVVSPSRDADDQLTVRITLRSPDGEAVLVADAEDVLLFLGRTYALVPAGAESAHLGLDQRLADLFDTA
jgi:hypothetical protein